jgi:hypothetical protein
MYWVPRSDNKFYNVRLNIGFQSTMNVYDEDAEIEPHRAAFIKATLALWEQEWLEEEGKKVQVSHVRIP